MKNINNLRQDSVKKTCHVFLLGKRAGCSDLESLL